MPILEKNEDMMNKNAKNLRLEKMDLDRYFLLQSEIKKKFDIFRNTKLAQKKKNIIITIIEDICNINGNLTIQEYVKTLKEIFLFLNSQSDFLISAKINLDDVYTSIYNNIEKYTNLLKTNEISFFFLFSQLIQIDKKTRTNDNFENFVKLFDKISDINYKDLDKVDLKYLISFVNDMNRSFYTNRKLNEGIIDYFINLNKNHLYPSLYSLITPLIYSRILEKIEKPKSLKFIEIFINKQVDLIKTQEISLLDSCNNFKSCCLLHSLLLNELTIKMSDNILKKLNGVLNFYVSHLYSHLDEIHNNLLYCKIIFRSFIYLRSLNFKKEKLSEMIKLLVSNQKFQSFLNKSKTSDFHRDFMKCLTELKIQFLKEDNQNYISKDIVLENSKICYELEGIHHMFYDREFNYQTLFKKNILKNYGWSVINVRYNEWQIMKKEEKLEYINMINSLYN